MCLEDHVAGMIANPGIGMCDAIVKKLHQCLHGGLCTLGLLGGECADCGK